MERGIGESIARNTTIMLAAQVVTWVSSFILLIFLPRYLGSEDFGRFYLAMSVGMIIGIVIDFGGNFLIPKEVSRSKATTPRILVSFIGVRVLLWICCMVAVLLFSYAVGYSWTVTMLIVIFGISNLWEGGSKAIRSCFQGYEQMEYPSVGVVAEKVFVSVIAVSALLIGAGSIEIAVIFTVGTFINLLICIKFLPRIVKHIPNFRLNMSYRLLKSSLPYFMWSIFAVIYFRIDAVMLSTMTTDEVVGWYGGAYRFFDIVMFLPAILTTVIFPVFSRLWEGSEDRLHNTFQQSIKYIFMAAIPVCILFFIFSEHLVSLFYGLEEYGPSVLVLQIFSIGIIFVYIDFIMGSAILATDRQRSWAVVGFVAVLINIGLNFMFIPYTQAHMGNGGIGAAITTLITEIFIMICAFFMLPGRYFHQFNYAGPMKCIASGAGMLVAILLLQAAGVHPIFQAVTGGMIYLLFIVSWRVISPDDWHFINGYFTIKELKSIISLNRKEI